MNATKLIKKLEDEVLMLEEQKRNADDLVKHCENMLSLLRRNGINDNEVQLFADIICKCRFYGIGND